MIIYTDKQRWAIERVEYWWNKLNLGYKSNLNPIPTVKFDNAKMTAGRAYSGQYLISLSNHFLHNESNYDQTIAHEVCHIFVDRFYIKRCNHGYEWQMAMYNIGLKANRCHDYVTSKHRASTSIITCNGCKGQVRLGKKMKTAVFNNHYVRCSKCNTQITKEQLAK